MVVVRKSDVAAVSSRFSRCGAYHHMYIYIYILYDMKICVLYIYIYISYMRRHIHIAHAISWGACSLAAAAVALQSPHKPLRTGSVRDVGRCVLFM